VIYLDTSCLFKLVHPETGSADVRAAIAAESEVVISVLAELETLVQLKAGMNTKDFLRLGVPLGEATRRATDFVAKFILGGGDKSRLREEVAAIVANPSASWMTRCAVNLRRLFSKRLRRRAQSL
jgi:uncharacterized protein with PIN domain